MTNENGKQPASLKLVGPVFFTPDEARLILVLVNSAQVQAQDNDGLCDAIMMKAEIARKLRTPIGPPVKSNAG